MFAKRVLPALILSLFWFSACGPPRVFPRPLPTSDGSWSIRLTQTGGFAGADLAMQVSSDGLMTAEDVRSGRTVSKLLSEATMTELNQLVAETTLSTIERPPSVCADCFIYELEITSTTGVVRVQADDTNLGESGAQMLILFLREIRDQALRAAT